MAVKEKIFTGQEVSAIRRKLRMNQSAFWSPLGITQSGGSRYESGRAIPKPIHKLLAIAYGSERLAEETVQALRDRGDNAV